MNKKEAFEKLEQKAMHNRDKYDYVTISREGAGANINGSGPRRIRNGFVIMEKDGTREEWNIDNGMLSKAPEYPFVFCSRNENNGAMCFGKRESEESYLFLQEMESEKLIKAFAIGAIEIAEYAEGFYFNWETKESYYIILDRYGRENSALYMIAKTLKEMQVKKNEQEVDYGTGNQKDNWFFSGSGN